MLPIQRSICFIFILLWTVCGKGGTACNQCLKEVPSTPRLQCSLAWAKSVVHCLSWGTEKVYPQVLRGPGSLRSCAFGIPKSPWKLCWRSIWRIKETLTLSREKVENGLASRASFGVGCGKVLVTPRSHDQKDSSHDQKDIPHKPSQPTESHRGKNKVITEATKACVQMGSLHCVS